MDTGVRLLVRFGHYLHDRLDRAMTYVLNRVFHDQIEWMLRQQVYVLEKEVERLAVQVEIATELLERSREGLRDG